MLKDQILVTGVFTDAAARVVNTLGTPLFSIAAEKDGRAIAGRYDLTFANVVPGVSADVTISPQRAQNPYNGTFAVSLDGETVYKNIIPGASLVFSDNGGFLNTWTCSVYLGTDAGIFPNAGAGANTPGGETRHKVVNTAAAAYEGCKASLETIAKWVKTLGNVFESVNFFAPGATEKTAGGGNPQVSPYVMKITTIAGAGINKTCSLLVDNVAPAANSIKDLTTGATQNGTLLKMVSGRFYQFVSGNLSGVIFNLSPDGAENDTANLFIFPSRFVEIAPDEAGAAGEYGTDDIALTQTGEAEGVIQPGEAAFFWARVIVPFGGNSVSNPYPTDVSISGYLTGGAF